MTYRHLRDPRTWTLPQVLAAQAEDRGDHLFVRALDGDAMTYAAAGHAAARVGGMLAAHGAGRGDRVVVIAPNSLDFVRLWLGAAHIGATLIPLNPGLHGGFLAHQLRVAAAHTVVCDGAYAPALAGVRGDIPAPSAVISIGEDSPALRADARFEQWPAAAAAAPEPADPRDPACVMFTSGTTGPSKGVLMPHGHCYLLGLGVIDNMALTAEDRYYVTMPLYHANALFMQLYATLIAGASAVLRDRFSASAWLADIRRHRCTITNLLGAMSQFVIEQPGHPSDRDHHLRAVLTAPNPPRHDAAWRERFGIRDVVSAYGMTEANIPAYGRLGESRPGTAGFTYRPYFEVRISDPDTDATNAPGTPGEICVRSTVPGGFFVGYLGMPEESLRAFRDFWFHTGDLGVIDAEGCLSYIDRQKDCIRRRGENISSFEVEAAISAHPGIREVAAFAVAAGAEGTEDEVMLAVVPGTGTLTPADVAEFADAALPRFARPRYIELMADLPKTPTERVRKAELRRRGVTPATWDRDNPGPVTPVGLTADRHQTGGHE